MTTQSPMTHTGYMPWDNIFHNLYKDKKSKIEHFEYKIVNEKYLTEETK